MAALEIYKWARAHLGRSCTRIFARETYGSFVRGWEREGLGEFAATFLASHVDVRFMALFYEICKGRVCVHLREGNSFWSLSARIRLIPSIYWLLKITSQSLSGMRLALFDPTSKNKSHDEGQHLQCKYLRIHFSLLPFIAKPSWVMAELGYVKHFTKLNGCQFWYRSLLAHFYQPQLLSTRNKRYQAIYWRSGSEALNLCMQFKALWF